MIYWATRSRSRRHDLRLHLKSEEDGRAPAAENLSFAGWLTFFFLGMFARTRSLLSVCNCVESITLSGSIFPLENGLMRFWINARWIEWYFVDVPSHVCVYVRVVDRACSCVSRSFLSPLLLLSEFHTWTFANMSKEKWSYKLRKRLIREDFR